MTPRGREWHSEGQGFESPQLHQIKDVRDEVRETNLVPEFLRLLQPRCNRNLSTASAATHCGVVGNEKSRQRDQGVVLAGGSVTSRSGIRLTHVGGTSAACHLADCSIRMAVAAHSRRNAIPAAHTRALQQVARCPRERSGARGFCRTIAGGAWRPDRECLGTHQQLTCSRFPVSSTRPADVLTGCTRFAPCLHPRPGSVRA